MCWFQLIYKIKQVYLKKFFINKYKFLQELKSFTINRKKYYSGKINNYYVENIEWTFSNENKIFRKKFCCKCGNYTADSLLYYYPYNIVCKCKKYS